VYPQSEQEMEAGDKLPRVRLIAFYLPQYHPIPENDVWWGPGFTEWTHVTRARPLFRGHLQPRLPADLGFYDLRVPETRFAQAALAREAGIEGFCYWHFWFAGKRLLERPFDEVVRSGVPDFPFCLAWANQSWSGIWHGSPDKILIEQTYPGEEDYTAHFHALLDAFHDDRYVKVEGKPLFVIFRPLDLPDPRRFTDLWRELAVKSGLKGMYFVGYHADPAGNPVERGLDAGLSNELWRSLYTVPCWPLRRIERRIDQVLRVDLSPAVRLLNRLFTRSSGKDLYNSVRFMRSLPHISYYADFIKTALPDLVDGYTQYPCVVPNWDNTPRTGRRGYVLLDSTPALFRTHLRRAMDQVRRRDRDQQIIFIRSWNEWGEGNYLEPDQVFGRAYLKVLKEEGMA
jgi:hypothetical protein